VPDSRRVLILGGTSEARELADALATRPGMAVITSLAGRTVAPRQPAGELRIGGFGGADGLAAYLVSAGIDRVIDATHPYADTISRHAVAACRETHRPLLRLERAPWQATAGDHWIQVDSLPAAALAAPLVGSRAFLSIGVQELAAFSEMRNLWFLVRLVEAPSQPLPLASYQITLGRGPFAVEDETRLLREHRIDLVIAKSSGGSATYGKIVAARALALPVMLLRRPAPPPARTSASIAEAVAWIEGVMA
jgi:precorrin-6A/cobalt-precorrin-6A reductase